MEELQIIGLSLLKSPVIRDAGDLAQPAVVFADEPSGNLDSANSKELHELFFSLRDKYQQTFLIATHNEELANMSDRKLTIKDGIIEG